MKRKFSVLKRLSLSVLALFLLANCMAQVLPGMWVDKLTSVERKSSYNLKHYLMSNYTSIEQTDSIFYPDFFNMITYFINTYRDYQGVRVYIAQYPTRQLDRKVPIGWENKLTLIFAPTKATGKDRGNYFVITPDKNFDAAKNEITPDQKKNWTRLYVKNILPSILETLDKTDEENYVNDNLSDTRSILFTKVNIDELMSELEAANQLHHRIGLKQQNITGVKAYFASYTSNGDKYGEHQNRLHIQFEFTNDKGEIIYLDDDDTSRTPKPITPAGSSSGLDNGQLCPANCP